MPYGDNTPAELERIATAIVDSAFKIHDKFGLGLLESVYAACLSYELKKRGLDVQRELVVPIFYDGVQLDTGLRIDLLVGDMVIVEVKAVEKHNALYEAQLLTYLKLTRKRLGILINFNVKFIKDGIKRVIL